MLPVRSDAHVTNRIREHVRRFGGLTAAEWIIVLKAPLLTCPPRGPKLFVSTTYDVKGGRLFVDEGLAVR